MSEYGRKACMKIASELAENKLTIVSGMAIGIDSTAHRATLNKTRCNDCSTRFRCQQSLSKEK